MYLTMPFKNHSFVEHHTPTANGQGHWAGVDDDILFSKAYPLPVPSSDTLGELLLEGDETV